MFVNLCGLTVLDFTALFWHKYIFTVSKDLFTKYLQLHVLDRYPSQINLLYSLILFCGNGFYFHIILTTLGAWGGVVDKALRY